MNSILVSCKSFINSGATLSHFEFIWLIPGNAIIYRTCDLSHWIDNDDKIKSSKNYNLTMWGPGAPCWDVPSEQ